MNLQDLVCFNQLAETLNFTATAEQFYVSQPSIASSTNMVAFMSGILVKDRPQLV